MFIVSQLNFSSYLNKPSYAAEAAQLPRLITLPEKYRRGDFDILLIHRRYGVLIGEIKSVGRSQPKLGKTPAEDDADVAKRVGRAIKQLDKSEIVVKHVLDDIARGLTVRKTLFLPNVGNAQLRRVLGADPLLEQVTRTKERARTHRQTHVRTHAHAHAHTRTHARAHARTHARTHTRTHTHTHIHTHTHTHARTRAHARTHAHEHTHAHIHLSLIHI